MSQSTSSVIDLNRLDLAPLLKATEKLFSALEEYQRKAQIYHFQSDSVLLQPFSEAAIATLMVEKRLSLLGLAPFTTAVSAMCGSGPTFKGVHALQKWLVDMRGGVTKLASGALGVTNWASVEGGVFALGDEVPDELPNMQEPLDRLRLCFADLQKGCLREKGPVASADDRSVAERLPRWDAGTRTLWFGEVKVREYCKRAAQEQQALLEAFHKSGWQRIVEAPKESKGTLRGTLRNLQENLIQPAPIRFGGGGKAGFMRWDPVPTD